MPYDWLQGSNSSIRSRRCEKRSSRCHFGRRKARQTCGGCKEEKPVSEFYKNKSRKGGFSYHCRVCHKENQKNFPPVNKEKKRGYNLKFNYGISTEQFQKMLSEQNGCCKICNRASEKLHVDHCHKTGGVRGLLCVSCNRTLGLFKDSAELLIRAAEYLEVFNAS